MRYAASEDLEDVTKAKNFAVRNCGSQFALSFTRATFLGLSRAFATRTPDGVCSFAHMETVEIIP